MYNKQPRLKYTVLQNYYIADKYTYEKLLCECLNASQGAVSFFGGQFSTVESQSNKEPDVICEDRGYELDFKLMISETHKEHMSRTALIVSEPEPGFKIFSAPPQLTSKVLLLWNCCRGVTKEKISEYESQKTPESKGVLHFFNRVLDCGKNILIFMPIIYDLEERTDSREKDFEEVFSQVSTTTKFFYEYRMEKHPDKDTFLIYLFRDSDGKESFVISKFSDIGLHYIDSVDVGSVPYMNQLRDYNEMF